MTPERQRDAFHVAQRKAAGYETSSAFAGRDLATIGESLYCYVPRLLRHLGFEQLLTMPYTEVGRLYEAGSWAINDLIRLLERIADEAGAEENGAAAELAPVTIDGDSLVGSEFSRSVPLKHGAEFESVASTLSPALHGDEQLSDQAAETSSEQETASCVHDEAMRTEFDSLRHVLLTHAAHPLLDEECEKGEGKGAGLFVP